MKSSAATKRLRANRILRPVFQSALFWPETGTCSDPGALTKSYARLFEKLGGVFVRGDARTLHRFAGGWRVETASGPVDGKQVVIALGPWSMDVAAGLACVRRLR
jgi:D-amino-acid dehydrogenase